MATLSKEETISALTAAIKQHEGRDVTIEQKGSWYKIDGGKSLRFSELEAMLASFNSGTEPAEAAKSEKAEKTAKPKAEKKAPAKKTAKKDSEAVEGKLPKEYWLDYLLSLGGTVTLPRGF
ncbi:hypothetical protein D5018_08640 [Parashewanella curva]|uniref:Uncharacterized protein n=1 Tax=Parashewanella curva TaxID=2338552 RepID=A0A3L8PXM9_9GAMM|nr:hypothetical protein [Parashewanella curva]RLV60080.1 hypothetical protein D5018_08640 [Parashewanella curva]